MKFLKNYPAMFMISFAAVMISATLFTSCKKDDVTPQPAVVSIEGMYAAKYGFDGDVPDTPEKYNIKAGGIFQQISINNGSVVGTGTWQLNGKKFTATHTSIFAPFNKNSISAAFNTATGKIVGTWGWETSTTDGGKIDMTKQ